MLARDGDRLFGDEMSANLFTSTGRRSVPPLIVATVMVRSRVTRYVIDAATLLHLVAGAIEVAAAHQLVAPTLIRSQALALLLAAVQRGDITNEVALRRHEGYTEIKMRVLGDRVSRRTSLKLAREHGWDSTFDAEYLAVCKLQADALVTIERALAEKAAGIVPTAPLEVLSLG